MYAVGRIGSYISRGVDTVAGPFHPFGGAVDMIVVQQVDGSLKSSPWYVRFGKFQGVLKTKEKVVNVTVNGVAAGFHMYLDHKGEAYFLNEVDGEEEEIGSSSGEDTDKQARGKRVTKSERFEMDVKQPNSARLADGRDECKREFGAWSNSRRARILGLVFGSRSFKERMTQVSPEDEELKRARLLERAEIAADLLELKWSTTLATKKPKKNYTLNSFLDEEIPRKRSEVSDKQEHDNDICEPDNSTVITDCSKDIVGLMTEVKSPMKYSVFVAAEPSDSLEIPGTKGNVGGVGDDLSSENPDKSNVILNPDSLICIQLVTDDSVDTEMAEVIHPTDVVITRTDEDGNTKMEDAHVSGYFSRQNSSCSSCISEEEVVEPEVTTTIAGEEVAESSPGSIDHQHLIDNITISDLDNSKLTAESTSPHSISDSPCGDGHSSQSNDLTYESFSSSDNPAQLKVANHLGEHAGIPDAVSPTQKSVHLSKSDNDISVTDGAKLSEELRGDPISSSAGDVTSKTWGIWPFSFKRSRSMKSSKSVSISPRKSQSCSYPDGTSQEDSNDGKQKVKGTRKKVKTVIPTSKQLASLNLKEGRNEVTFTFSTAMLGDQQVDAKIYVWKWNARIVISDVDGTITRSDVLGQVMPLVGMDWSHIGVTQLFSAIKENGYHLLFLSARSISQAYHTRQFLFNLKQNGCPLPEGPVVISPDGLFPSLFREVIRRAPHEFKIACLEDIKACFPPDCNPFYAGFGNRDTDEFSYLKVGIPKGKIFIINPKGEVAVHRRLDTKSYTSLHSLVNDIFPPTSTTEQEDFNSWNFWKLPPPTM